MEIVEVAPEPDPDRAESLVYVAVGKARSSMDAVRWALRNEVGPSSEVVLVHVFPEVREIPTPLGNLPRSGVNPQQLESHMIQVRAKRRELLEKFIRECNSSKVKVDTVLIEGDQIAQAILELITVIGIQKLIIGASKSSLRKLGKGAGGKEEQILKGAPEGCEVKIICDGTQVSATSPASLSASSLPQDNKIQDKLADDEASATICGCF